MSSSSFRTPKGCIVKSIELHVGHAELSMDCGGPEGGGRGKFPLPGGEAGWSNYPKARVKGVRRIHLPGSSVSGQAHVGFELIPRSATCSKRRGDFELRCKLKGPDGVLEGKRRRRG